MIKEIEEKYYLITGTYYWKNILEIKTKYNNDMYTSYQIDFPIVDTIRKILFLKNIKMEKLNYGVEIDKETADLIFKNIDNRFIQNQYDYFKTWKKQQIFYNLEGKT
jgi:chorismate mutase